MGGLIVVWCHGENRCCGLFEELYYGGCHERVKAAVAVQTPGVVGARAAELYCVGWELLDNIDKFLHYGVE